jgi:hypothetical protein
MNYYFVVHQNTRIALPRILTSAPTGGQLQRLAAAADVNVADLIVHAVDSALVKRRDMNRIKWCLPVGEGAQIRPATAAEMDGALPVGEQYISRVKLFAKNWIEAVIPGLEATQPVGAGRTEFLLKGSR